MLDQPLHGGLRAHSRHTGDVVGFVACEGEEVDDLLGFDTELRLDTRDIKGLVIHRVHQRDMGVHQLREVFITRGHQRRNAEFGGAMSKRADDVVGLDAGDD